MRTAHLCLALCAVGLTGCLDDHSGPQDQWLNTDAYVAPEGGAGDGGVTQPACSDDAGPAFGRPTQVSADQGADAGAGPTEVQSDLALVPTTGGARLLGWVDRSLAFTGQADLRVAPVAADAVPGSEQTLARPTGCAALVEPALGVTASGTVLLAAVCLGGSEQQPTRSDIVLFRSTDGGASFGEAATVVTCPADTTRCAHPSLAATGAVVRLAWADETVSGGAVTAGALLVVRSDDDGVTFGAAPVPVSDSFADVATPRLAAAGTVLHVVYAGAMSLGGTTYVAYARLDDPSGSFTPAQNLGPGHSPDLAASADGVLVVWGAAGYVQEAHAAAGAGFSPPLPVDMSLGATDVLAPAVARAESGTIHLFWQAQLASGWEAVYSRSTDGAGTWSTPLVVAGPYDGDPRGQNPMHRIGPGALVVDSAGVLAAWAQPGSDPLAAISNVYLAPLVCD